MKDYAGVCYDGPWEGRQVANKYSRFPVCIFHGSPLDFVPSRHHDTYGTSNLHFYVWSQPLRKWVFVPHGY